MMSPVSNFSRSIFTRQKEMSDRSILLVRVYFFSIVMFLIDFAARWRTFAARPQLQSSWAGDWIFQFEDTSWWITWITCLAVLFAFFTALRPLSLTLRFFSFLFFQIFLSYYIAVYGYANHSYYGFTMLSFVLLALPTEELFRKARRQAELRVITCMRLAAASLITIYFLVGLGNVHGGIVQLLRGEMSIFSPQSVAYFVLYEIQTSATEGILAHFIIEHSWVFWTGVFVILIKKLSGPFILIFRSQWVPWLGVGLICFHFFNALAFGLHFKDMAFQIALFLVLSPICEIRSRTRI